MASIIAVMSLGLAMLEAIITVKLSSIPDVPAKYAASAVGYNTMAFITMSSALTPVFELQTTPIAFGVAVLCALGISAIGVDGLIPPTGNRYIDQGIDLMVKAGILLAIYSVPLLAFPTYVSPSLRL